ncbi:up-regulator of cell proliferation-like [Micropterus dolomieu]|uniref:up-regulator of cell proliferation-like n=1 Tax=Micropterus dolomieu TaxID=147949 RepID=UPI001E8C9E9B|nr:up-regulator of cell proliferation-like [Micropterus dolomieu]
MQDISDKESAEDTPSTPWPGSKGDCQQTDDSSGKETQLESLLEDLGLEHHYTEKLSLGTVLQIEERTITDEPAKCISDLPWYFLKKLMMVNVTARNVKCTSECESTCEDASGNTELDLDDLFDSLHSGDVLNPLDIITALFLCSDGFVRQEMALKMSMCQFSVPLLLPNCDTKQCTLMLWAMRDIVKKYRPQKLLESKGFIEERIVVSELPMISFVRLGECSLSKSETLNKLLSNSQQYHDTFIHHNMECGDSSRRISNGLTEVTWYLPCGNKNMDIFSEPVAVANLRGDIASFETQFSFLCQTSAAVFVFFDNLDSECELLTNQHHKAQIFLVGNHQRQSFSLDALKKVANKLGLTKSNILLKAKHMNDADFIKLLQKTISNVVENTKMKMGIEQMADIAHELGILVDEDCAECQTAKKNADAITAEIQDTLKYKEAQLPLQGQIWKELTVLEKEEFRLRKVGSENIEKYKSDLQIQKRKLRVQQNSCDMSNAMTCFINAISSPGIERSYFLKWMRMNLDNLSREKLSGLRELYKKKCENSENKEEIFSTRMFFQYSVLLDLLSKDDFENYKSYICSYEDHVKKWTHKQIEEHFSKGDKVFEFEDRHVLSSINSINDAINKAKTEKSGNVKTFVEDVCQELGDKLVISQDALGAFMILNNADQEQFAHWLTECVKDMAQALREKFKTETIQIKLENLLVKPQSELFSKVIGCGKQCPFCKAPCDAGASKHGEHFAQLHRPEGLGRFRWDGTEKLVTDICSSLVNSDMRFRCNGTKGEYHPYKNYREIFPDWIIQSDVSLEASDYWKYVLAKFNKEFAKAYNAEPADIPETWKTITRKQAEASLKESFNIK